MARQTYSYLRNLFAHRGIAPRHRLGQNFLIDLNIHEVIAKAAKLSPHDVVLEVGPGAGALTALMAPQVSAVVAVEIDPAMAQLTREAASGHPNVRVLSVDALAGKNRINPEVIDNLRAGLAVGPDRRLKLIANLPYHIATPLITNLLVHPDVDPALMVVTIQRELADRLIAEPMSEAYGGLSVIVQALAEVEVVRTLPPKVFWPRPKVDSSVVAITPDPAKRAAIADLGWFHSVVRRVFLHRRKHLRGVLYNAYKDEWKDKAEVDELLAGLDLGGEVRAEALNVAEFRELATALRAKLGEEIARQEAKGAKTDAKEEES